MGLEVPVHDQADPLRWASLVQVSDGKGREHVVEQTSHDQEAKEEKEGPGSHSLIWLKDLPQGSPCSATLGTKPLAHGRHSAYKLWLC
jgi:hypothetical protein